ncbi:MAG: alanine racemase [Thermoleophilia bacterium]
MPKLTIDLAKIQANASLVAELIKPHGLRLVGVTKGCLGNELVAEAMLAGGATALADSRVESIANLRRHFPGVELELLRSPVAGRQLDASADIHFVSSLQQAMALLGLSITRPVRLCLMVETGDCREGVPAELAVEEAALLTELADSELVGIATNAACARESAPLGKALATFTHLAQQLHWRLKMKEGQALPVISAGGSGLLKLMIGISGEAGGMDALFGPLTELRCGEVILLGRIPSGEAGDLYLPKAHRDAFLLEGVVLEVYEKAGRTQALVDFGCQDTGSASLIPYHEGITPVETSSDYLTVACDPPESLRPGVTVGNRLTFIPSYYALLAAMTSPFVEKKFLGA